MDNYFHIWERFKVEQHLVKEFTHWLVVVRPSQVTLGDCLILIKRPVESIGDLRADEAQELPRVVAWYEKRAREAFHAERFNYIAAMMKDPYVHFHAFPRYSAEQTKYGITWKDEVWPNVIEFKKVDTPEETLLAIRDTLRGAE